MTSVEAYLSAQPPAARAMLKELRAIVRRALPGAEERISYQMPAYRIPEGFVVYLGGWKHHVALYPIGPAAHEVFATELAAHDVDKGTLRFPLGTKVPAKLVAGIVKVRAQEVIDLKRARAAKKKAPSKKKTPARKKAPKKAPTQRKPPTKAARS